MKIFKLTTDSTTVIDLTVENYETATHRREPYYAMEKGEEVHFAVCPGCNNPIKLVNLYDGEIVDENNNSQPLHARHRKGNVNKIATYNKEKYLKCSLSGKNYFSRKTLEHNLEKRNEILNLVLSYPDILYQFVKDITSINFSRRKFVDMIIYFIETKKYYYKGLSPFNLPYGFLYMLNSIRIIKQYIKDNSHQTNELQKSIAESNYFTLCNNQIQKLKSMEFEFVAIDFYLTKHRTDENLNQTVEFRLTETKDKKTNVLFKNTIYINQRDYINAINDAKQREETAEEENKKRSELKNMIRTKMEEKNL